MISQICVNTLQGRLITIDCESGWQTTVLEIMQHVQDKEGVPPEHQRLICGNVELNKREILSHYCGRGMAHGCTVHLRLRVCSSPVLDGDELRLIRCMASEGHVRTLESIHRSSTMIVSADGFRESGGDNGNDVGDRERDEFTRLKATKFDVDDVNETTLGDLVDRCPSNGVGLATALAMVAYYNCYQTMATVPKLDDAFGPRRVRIARIVLARSILGECRVGTDVVASSSPSSSPLLACDRSPLPDRVVSMMSQPFMLPFFSSHMCALLISFGLTATPSIVSCNNLDDATLAVLLAAACMQRRRGSDGSSGAQQVLDDAPPRTRHRQPLAPPFVAFARPDQIALWTCDGRYVPPPRRRHSMRTLIDLASIAVLTDVRLLYAATVVDRLPPLVLERFVTLIVDDELPELAAHRYALCLDEADDRDQDVVAHTVRFRFDMLPSPPRIDSDDDDVARKRDAALRQHRLLALTSTVKL
jgi:Ubiquitin family